jgi:hypothetical protein
MAFTPVTLTGTYEDGAGGPLSGTLTITLSQVMSNGNVTITPIARVVDLDDHGSFSITILANTDAETVPQGTWYEVTEQLTNADAQAKQRDYSIQIPALLLDGDPVTSIDITALMPGTPMGFDPTSNPSGTVQWTTYLDTTEVLDWLQFTGTPDPGSATSGLLQRMIDSACYRAQAIANRPFCPTTMYERHDGWSGEYIQLEYSPFIKLIQCGEWQSTGGLIILPESTPENPVDGIQINYKTSRIMRTFAGYSWPRPFYPGSRNIEVTYIAGFNPVPPDVWEATIDLVAYWYRNTQQASRTFTGTSAAYGGAQGGSGDLWPGIPNRLSDVFESYRLPVIG